MDWMRDVDENVRSCLIALSIIFGVHTYIIRERLFYFYCWRAYVVGMHHDEHNYILLLL